MNGGTGALAAEYRLARQLGTTVARVRTLPHSEVVGWRAFFAYEAKRERMMAELAAQKGT